MSKDLRLDYYDHQDDTVELLRKKLQANVEKLQLILDVLTGVTPTDDTPVTPNPAPNQPAPNIAVNEIKIGDGYIRWNVDGWLEYNQGEGWLKFIKGPAIGGDTPVWLEDFGGPYWSATGNMQLWKDISAAYTIKTGDCIIRADASTASFTITMPAPNVCAGKLFYIKKLDATANKITVDADTFEIDAGSTVILTIPQQVVCLHSLSTKWELLTGYP